MKQLRHLCLACGFIAFVIFLLYSCQKEKNAKVPIPEGQQRIRIRLSDNPVNFDAVNVDIQRVEVLVVPDSCHNNDGDDDNGNNHHDNDGDDDGDDHHCAVWDTLEIRAGVYNLLDLSNGADTLLANDFTRAGNIEKIRLTLGSQNSVLIDSVSYPLNLWGDHNRVTIKLKGEEIEELTPGDLQIWLDFDAGRSIVRIRDNHFVLKPYLRIWLPGQSASIEGKIIPLEAKAVVSAVTNGDTLIAIPGDDDGRFKIRGLKGETADIFINATANGYKDTMITAVELQKGKDTDIGTIELHN